jgi:hypothetical protein
MLRPRTSSTSPTTPNLSLSDSTSPPEPDTPMSHYTGRVQASYPLSAEGDSVPAQMDAGYFDGDEEKDHGHGPSAGMGAAGTSRPGHGLQARRGSRGGLTLNLSGLGLGGPKGKGNGTRLGE